jgi:lipopolysaccharide/colanic/teichoic acid biosynthesis glycosyltransferase
VSIPRNFPIKNIFDKVGALGALLFLLPLFFIIILSFILEALIHPDCRGKLLSPYWSCSSGKRFKKYKFRVVKASLINQNLEASNDFSAYPGTQASQNLTCLGRFLKKYYLDELPQLFNIVMGDMSIVGPRAVAWDHYHRDVKAGWKTKEVLKAGIFSETHVRKGTEDFRNKDLDDSYLKKLETLSPLRIIELDMRIILKGLSMIKEGKGY